MSTLEGNLLFGTQEDDSDSDCGDGTENDRDDDCDSDTTMTMIAMTMTMSLSCATFAQLTCHAALRTFTLNECIPHSPLFQSIPTLRRLNHL